MSITQTDLGQLIWTIIPGLVIAAVTAILTVWLALRRFYSERWWERKAEAYSKIVEALYQLRNYAHVYLESVETGKEIPEERRAELEAAFKGGYDEIDRAAGIGAFIISDDAARSLANTLEDLERLRTSRQGSLYEYIELQWSILDKCLAKIRELAKKDLKIG